jgi:hypothetical protein
LQIYTSPSNSIVLILRASLQMFGSFPGLPAGSWQVQAFVVDVGYALSQQPVFVTVNLELMGASPRAGGGMGGTILEVNGRGVDTYFPDRNRWPHRQI